MRPVPTKDICFRFGNRTLVKVRMPMYLPKMEQKLRQIRNLIKGYIEDGPLYRDYLPLEASGVFDVISQGNVLLCRCWGEREEAEMIAGLFQNARVDFAIRRRVIPTKLENKFRGKRLTPA